MSTGEYTRQEAIDDLKELQTNLDPEDGHVDADQILVDLLESLGYVDVTLEYEKIEKWYS